MYYYTWTYFKNNLIKIIMTSQWILITKYLQVGNIGIVFMTKLEKIIQVFVN